MYKCHKMDTNNSVDFWPMKFTAILYIPRSELL